MMIIYSTLLMYVTWVFFTAVMRLREVRDAGNLTFRKRPVNFILGHSALFIGVILDVYDNWAFFSVIGLETPKEWLSTARLCRWYPSSDDRIISRWRAGVAKFFGEQILDDLDPDGPHIT